MKIKIFAAFALFLACTSCVKVNNGIGANLISDNLKFKVYSPKDIPLEDFDMACIDSLSGYSDQWFSVGSIRDAELGLTSRQAVMTLVPLCYDGKWDFGKNPSVRFFHFAIGADSTSIADLSQSRILQNLNVYEICKPLDPQKDFNCAEDIEHKSEKINKPTLVNGTDSLSFNFTDEFAKKYFTITPKELTNMDEYLKRFPGIYIETDDPNGIGGRINNYGFQLGYDVQNKFITGNFAKLCVNSEYNGVRKDTTFYFYVGAPEYINIDTLFNDYSTGNFIQYALTLAKTENAKERECNARDKKTLTIEGGLGPKPLIRAKELARLTKQAIIADGNDPKKAIINSASLEFSFEFPSDYNLMYKFPKVLSPLCLFADDTSAVFVNLTDFSDENGNIGEINRASMKYSPSITYHLQEILNCTDKELEEKNRDIYLMSMFYETYSNTSVNKEMSDYYKYLAYQSYYSSMYGSGQGGYGSYTDYYSYLTAAQMASGTTSANVSLLPDKTRFYSAKIYGPATPDKSKAPKLKLIYSVPIK